LKWQIAVELSYPSIAVLVEDKGLIFTQKSLVQLRLGVLKCTEELDAVLSGRHHAPEVEDLGCLFGCNYCSLLLCERIFLRSQVACSLLNEHASSAFKLPWPFLRLLNVLFS